jgi:hypothetical protein
MDDILVYLLLTSALSILQFREVYKIFQAGEKPFEIDWAFSFLEFIWFIVSIAILFNDTLTFNEALIPVFYIVYNIFGWHVSYSFYKDVNVLNLVTYVVPGNYIKISLIYCILFFIFTIFVFSQSFPLRNEVPILTYLKSNWTVAFWFIIIVLYIKAAFSSFISSLISVFEKQAQEAINNNDICISYFGEIETIEQNDDITAKYANNIFAYNIKGTRASGLLIAEFLSKDSDTEIITDGFIETDDGSIIELEKITLK